MRLFLKSFEDDDAELHRLGIKLGVEWNEILWCMSVPEGGEQGM